MRTSEQINDIAAAFAAAQAEISTVKKDKKASVGKYGYTYASLAVVMESIAKPLAGHGLAVVQSLSQDANQVTVTTRLLHISGQWIEGDCTMPVGANGPQAVGSAITYGRRYGVSALLGIVTDDDDDGAEAQRSSPQGRVAQRQPRVNLDKIIGAMHAARSIEELNNVAVQLKAIQISEDQRTSARLAWQDAKHRIETAAGHDYGPPPMTDDDVAGAEQGQPEFGFGD